MFVAQKPELHILNKHKRACIYYGKMNKYTSCSHIALAHSKYVDKQKINRIYFIFSQICLFLQYNIIDIQYMNSILSGFSAEKFVFYFNNK